MESTLTIQEPRELSLMDVIQRAISTPDMDFARIQQLLDLKERWDAAESKKAFVTAMAAFKGETIRIVRDKDNKQYGSKYVSLGHLIDTVTPFLSKHGLSARWDIDQASGIKVTCILTHAQGHSESVVMTCPPDKSGAKNPIQEIKSAITYARVCTFENVCGLASSDGNGDDDGNGAGSKPGVSDQRFIEMQEQIENASAEKLQQVFGAAYKEAKAINDQNSMKQLVRVYEARKKELQ